MPQIRFGARSSQSICGWSLVGGRGSPLHQSSGASCDGEGSLRAMEVAAGPSCHCIFGQHLSCVFLSLSERSFLTGPQRVGSMVSLLSGASEHLDPPSVCSRPRKCNCRRSISPQSVVWGRVASLLGGLRHASQASVGVDQSVCFLSHSPL